MLLMTLIREIQGHQPIQRQMKSRQWTKLSQRHHGAADATERSRSEHLTERSWRVSLHRPSSPSHVPSSRVMQQIPPPKRPA